MKGLLEFCGINLRTGKREVFDVVENTILDAMYGKLVGIFGGETNDYINRMQFGTGTLSPAHTQEFLQTPITPIKTVASEIDGSSAYTVIFTAYLLATEGNGFPISEAGLITADSVTVTRATFTARTKTTSYTFGFRWSILVKAG